MLRGFLFLILAALAAASSADGPGTRIRATPSGPGAPVQSPPGPADRDAQRCEAMHQEAKDRCMRELRAAQRDPTLPPHAGPSPETAGSGATTR